MPAVKGLIDKYILHRPTHAAPPISSAAAVALLVLYTVIYVAPFYLSRLTRPSATLSRDAPSVIRARIASVSLSCAVCSALTLLLLTTNGHPGDPARLPLRDALHAMGYLPLGCADAARVLLLTAALFLGPLFELLVVERAWRSCAAWPRELGDWAVWRNLVAGPVTEEVLFRGAAVPLLLLAATPVRRTVLLSPVVFGLAHLHHAYEFALTHPRTPKAAVAARSLVQFAYTTLFGCYATFLFLRTGSLLAVCAVHSFCNTMGLPRFYGRVQRDGDGDGDREGDGPPGNLLWTLAYYTLLVVGAVYWYRHLWTLTESTAALVSF